MIKTRVFTHVIIHLYISIGEGRETVRGRGKLPKIRKPIERENL